eukprot:CAMPEP_0119359878 /NCGR_PEP_ID=MMETSP1334-20130426/7655_1 /TAXON_ID=127549 /ORGANISM="Calcidiscus leptoporus, Strain RCC1130" /LENGTH=104 /DNA_ID=CAMNT_0007374625 /DNA_START=184 /DNA_END=495 /DNA_ORIENTATION=+
MGSENLRLLSSSKKRADEKDPMHGDLVGELRIGELRNAIIDEQRNLALLEPIKHTARLRLVLLHMEHGDSGSTVRLQEGVDLAGVLVARANPADIRVLRGGHGG